MACDLMPQRHCRYPFSVQSNNCFSISSSNCPQNFRDYPFKCLTKCANGYNSPRFRIRTVPKASANKDPNTIPRKPKSRVAGHQANAPEPDPDPDPDRKSFSVLPRLWEDFKVGGIGMQILSIALPAAVALAADPITSLVDTGFVGHIGSAELAAVGVSGAIFNLVSKLFNVPLLNVTTSFVAEEQASVLKAADNNSQSANDQQSKIFLPSVSNAIMLAVVLGIVEAVALSTGSSFLMNTIGLTNACAS